jgi:NADH-quinone oxidoreductase subunit K
MLLSSLLNFSCFSIAHDDLTGQLICLLILTIGATESAIGLGIVILFFRLNNSIVMSAVTKLQG